MWKSATDIKGRLMNSYRPAPSGFHVAVAGYTLAPEATMDGIVREARTALRWLHQHLTTLGGDPARLYIGGWSAGGHLAAMLMDEPVVAGGFAIRKARPGSGTGAV